MKRKVILVLDRKLKVSIYRDLESLQSKFDLLFTTAKLMGYKFIREDIDMKDFATYAVYMHGDDASKSMRILFNLSKGKLSKIAITTSNGTVVFQKYDEKELLEELDKLLIYI